MNEPTNQFKGDAIDDRACEIATRADKKCEIAEALTHRGEAPASTAGNRKAPQVEPQGAEQWLDEYIAKNHPYADYKLLSVRAAKEIADAYASHCLSVERERIVAELHTKSDTPFLRDGIEYAIRAIKERKP